MTYILCIDGGGTKTRAVLAYTTGDESPTYTFGEAGPANLAHSAPSDRLVLFDRVWGGYAGCARLCDREMLYPALRSLFPRATVRLTSDAELLTAPMITLGYDKAVTLICGTGSLALAWTRRADDITQTGRSGGWGSLLGDEGSGWSLGKEAVKSVLTYAANQRELLDWHKEILQRFGVADPDRLVAAAISLDPQLPHPLADSERKKRIASCSPVVYEASEGDAEARRIVESVAAEVIQTLAPLVLEEETRSTVLVVTGGLSQADRFWEQVEKGMASLWEEKPYSGQWELAENATLSEKAIDAC
ncbi:hypothetical protein P7C73_g2695, partial [Tremellales sp. Uapishka_1]